MRTTIVAVACLFATQAFAQDASPQTVQQQRCWLGNMGYSSGSTMKASDGVMQCSDDFKWIDTDTAAAGCVSGGDFYAVGAVENGPRSDSVKMTCQSDGTWIAD